MTSAEKNSRKKIRISIIDVLIFITVIACIGGIFVHYKIYENENAVVTDDVCRVSVLFSGVEPEVAEKAVAGDKIYLKDEGVLGTVVEVTAADAAAYYTNAKNEIVEGIDGTKKDVTLLIEVAGDVTPDGFLANGTKYMASGMNIDVYTSKFSGNGLIFDVKQQTE